MAAVPLVRGLYLTASPPPRIGYQFYRILDAEHSFSWILPHTILTSPHHPLSKQQLRTVGCGTRYAAPLYIDIEETIRTKDADGEVLSEEQKAHDKIFVGEVPIMLRSSYCSLFEKTDRDLTGLGECPYDQARPLPRCHHSCPSLQAPFPWDDDG